jgi:PAS domain S-box-containing protein
MRILLVEDNADHREVMSRALTRHDPTWQVEEVASGEEALRRVAEKEPYDLVFLDYSLPQQNGLEVLEQVRQGQAPPPLVMVTGRGDEQVAVEAMKAGAYDYVVKAQDYLQRLPVVAQRAVEAHQLSCYRKRAEEQLRRQGAVLNGINRVLLESLTCQSDEEIACTCLAVAEELTGSQFGFIWEVNQAGRCDTIAISNPGWDACTIPETEAMLMLRDMEIRGIRGRVIKDERSMLFNHPASHLDWVGTPGGHPPITCFLGVPLKHGGRTIGMIGLANKESGYVLADQQAIETLAVAFVEALDRKRAEEALRESQQLLEKTFTSLEEAVFVVDPTTRTVVACNPAVKRIFGYNEKEVIGKNTEFLHVDRTTYERFGQELFPVLDADGVFQTQFQLRRKDGSIFFSEHTVTEIVDDSGQRTGLVSVVRDITEQVRAEEALRESEERYRSLFEDIPVGLYRTKPGGQILDANPALAEMLGYPDRDSLLQINAADVYVKAEERRRWQILMEGEGVVQGFEVQLRRRDGTIIWGRDNARAIQDSQGRVLYYEGAVKDITESKMAEKALHQRADDLSALYEASHAFLGHLDTEVIIEGICRLAVDRFGLKMAWVGLVAEGSFDVRPAFAYGFEEGYLHSIRITWDDSPTGRGPTGTAIRTGQATVINHVESDPTFGPWREAAEARGYRSSAALPLCHGEQVLGALNVYSAQPAYFTDERVQVLQSFANQAAVAIENARLFEQVRAGGERLQALSRQLLEVQEAERRHIARELHDEIGQALTGLKLLLDMSTRLPADEVTASLSEAQALINGLVALVRDLSLDLRPAMLDDLGLLSALLWHFDRYTAQTHVHVTFKHSGLEGRRLASEIETATYRIVQEALTNVARHAGVNEVMVRLWTDQNALIVQIEDRGMGFDREAALTASHTTGLAGMRERAVLLGGQLTVESAPEAGTTVTAELPLGGPSAQLRTGVGAASARVVEGREKGR